MRRGVGSDLSGSVEVKDIIMLRFEGQVIRTLHGLDVGSETYRNRSRPEAVGGARWHLQDGADGRKSRLGVWFGHLTCLVGYPPGRGERQANLSVGKAKGSLFKYDFCSRH